MAENVSIAVILASHNRREKTLRCLGSLFHQELEEPIDIRICLVDDGSNDGTSDAVSTAFPEVTIVSGDGGLFWNRAMRLGWEHAATWSPEWYLWVNDDLLLFPDALSTLLRTARNQRNRFGEESIIVGSTVDPQTLHTTYGAFKRRLTRSLDFILIEPSRTVPLEADTMNGNLVLLPEGVPRRIGYNDPVFTHALGDLDYGLRAKAAGIGIWVAPGHLAECSKNAPAPWTLPQTSIRERWRNLNSPKGLPIREWVTFCQRHTGFAWPYYSVKPLARVLLPALWHSRKDGGGTP